MNRWIRTTLGLTVSLALVLAACSEPGETVEEAEANAPSVGIVGLEDGQVVSPDHRFTIRSSSPDRDSRIESVVVTLNGTSVALDPSGSIDVILSTIADLDAGTYELHVVATDSEGREVESRVTFLVDPTVMPPPPPPTEPGGDVNGDGDDDDAIVGEVRVALVAPADGSAVAGDVDVVALVEAKGVSPELFSVSVRGNRLDLDPTRESLSPSGDFVRYRNTVTFDSNDFPDGDAQIVVVAESADGSVSDSASVSVTIANDDTTAPEVVWVTPSAGATVSGDAVALEFEATDNTGVASVRLFANDVRIGSSESVSWDTTGVPNGSVSLRAEAVDAAGNVGSSTLQVTVDNPAELETSLVAPSAGAVVSADVTVTAEVRALGVGDPVVSLSVNGTKVTDIPVDTDLGMSGAFEVTEFEWVVDSTTFSDGTAEIVVTAENADGSLTDSSSVSVTVANEDMTSPTVEWLQPLANEPVSGAAVTLEVEASDAGSGVAEARFFVGENRVATVAGSGGATETLSFDWDSTSVSDGDRTLRVVVFDVAGNRVESSILVTVANEDTTPPEITWVAPSANSTVSGTVSVEFEAMDDVGVATVRLFANDVRIGSSESVVWDTTDTPNGSVTLRAEAVDAAGNVGSSTLQVTVDNPAELETSFSSPTAGSVVSADVTVTAEVRALGVADPVVSLSVTGTKVTGAPVETDLGMSGAFEVTEFAWVVDSTAFSDGDAEIVVRAESADGSVSDSSSVSVRDANEDTTPPSVSWMIPAADAIVGNRDVTLRVAAVDDEVVARVEFYANDVLIGTTTSPVSGDEYEVVWDASGQPAGEVTLRARAVDDSDNEAEAELNLNLVEPAEIVNPESGDSVGPNADRRMVDVLIGLTGTLPDGVSVSRVDLLIGGQASGIFVEPPMDDTVILTWDTCDDTTHSIFDGAGLELTGDRTLTAVVQFTTGDEVSSPGVLVNFEGGC